MDYVDTDAYVAPSTDTEHLLCQIFADILHVNQVGIHDNFFEFRWPFIKSNVSGESDRGIYWETITNW
ncbi:hypothetical protein UM876_05965 [Staphylococcus aureus]|nr:hypothetical protein UM876_05965 [Staphylococcus aureus]